MYVSLDLETTGFSPFHDSIIEFSFIKYDKNGKKREEYSSLVKVEKEIPEIVTQITGIKNSDLKDSPTFSSCIGEIEDFIDGSVLIGHNIAFDLSFLSSHGIEGISNMPYIDTFLLANFLHFDHHSLNLGELCKFYSITLENAHRAYDDAAVTALLFFKLIETLRSRSSEEKDILSYLFSKINNTFVRDIFLGFLGQKAISKEDFIVIFTEKISDYNKKNIDRSLSNTVFKMEDFIDNIPGFEPRKSQNEMIDIIDKSFKKGTHECIEAPTGTGKTFAYLIPAIFHVKSTGEQVFVSTSTKTLQDQLYLKDLQTLTEISPIPFSYAKLKGKSNYISLVALFREIFSEEIGDFSKVCFYAKLALWSYRTQYGELEEITLYNEEYSWVEDIHAADSESLSPSNPYLKKEFLYKARKRAIDSDIIITNHHILLQDLQGANILGEIDTLVLDEAHALEDVVSSSLRLECSFDMLQKLCKKIEVKYSPKDFQLLSSPLIFAVSDLFSSYETVIFDTFNENQKYKSMLLPDHCMQEGSESMILIQSTLRSFEYLVDLLQDNELQESFEYRQIENMYELLRSLIRVEDRKKYIYSIEHSDKRGTLLRRTLLFPGEFLSENLWKRCSSIILTSATLSMHGDISYISQMLSLEDFHFSALASDFDYASQSLLFIPTDLGSIKYNSHEIIQFLGTFSQYVSGNTLMLFSSFQMISQVYMSLCALHQSNESRVLAQSISGGKSKVLRQFLDHADSTFLLGTDSFWEGVDIPGDALQYVIIHKIPFHVPTDPIFIARSKLFKDSFIQYAIPKAVLKLKQGFGRLIRSKKDSGVVVFLDDRIYTTKWGKFFLQSFPEDIPVKYASSVQLFEILRKKSHS